MLSFALTIFAAAFLLFQVQPLIAKFILPWFGGSSSVWTTCMLFFQVLLLLGYAYAHLVVGFLRPRWQAVVHLSLLLVAAALLPITPQAAWKPSGGENPTLRILALLVTSVGIQGLAVASTGPLLQRWFSLAGSGRSPYRLYALSNVGSLLALLSYPFLVEPNLSRQTQAVVWSGGFIVFASLSAWCAAGVWKRARGGVPAEDPPGEGSETPGARSLVLWLLLPACGSALLLAVTNQLCLDVAVVPFLWILPLSVYLFTYILAFDSPRWYLRPLFAAALPVAGGAVWLMLRLARRSEVTILTQIVAYSLALFVFCMVCHGELVRLKPHPRHLTSFYLMIAAGGALGGVLVAVVAPLTLKGYFELHLGVVGCFVLAAVAWSGSRNGALSGGRPLWAWAGVVAGFLAVAVGLSDEARRFVHGAVEITRGFYGVLAVNERDAEDPLMHAFVLYHGRIVHGLQFQDPEKRHWATTYFGEEGGAGMAIRLFRAGEPRKIGIVGLGAGTLAAHARAGDAVRFYELNPQVERIARSRFTFLADTPARVDVVLGDARISLEREPPQGFHILVLDAFSGDAIPVHLLSREAFDLYLRHLRPDGVIAVHVSNQYLDLQPVISRLADEFGLHHEFVEDYRRSDAEDDDPIQAAQDIRRGLYSSDWVLLSRDRAFLRSEEIQQKVLELSEDLERADLWTDDRNDLFRILKD